MSDVFVTARGAIRWPFVLDRLSDLQLTGDIPADVTRPISGLDAPVILGRERAKYQ
ncbi:hypothetical protein ACC796_36710 [Rhizobium ruizarguesonis]